MDQVQLALDGAPFEQDFVQMFASNIMQLWDPQVQTQSNSWINVRSSLLVLIATAVHG